MEADRERCLAAGMDGYISKPISPDALFTLLADHTGDGTVRKKCDLSAAAGRVTAGPPFRLSVPHVRAISTTTFEV